MRAIDADGLKDSFCLNCSTLKRYKRSVEECRANTNCGAKMDGGGEK